MPVVRHTDRFPDLSPDCQRGPRLQLRWCGTPTPNTANAQIEFAPLDDASIWVEPPQGDLVVFVARNFSLWAEVVVFE